MQQEELLPLDTFPENDTNCEQHVGAGACNFRPTYHPWDEASLHEVVHIHLQIRVYVAIFDLPNDLIPDNNCLHIRGIRRYEFLGMSDVPIEHSIRLRILLVTPGPSQRASCDQEKRSQSAFCVP